MILRRQRSELAEYLERSGEEHPLCLLQINLQGFIWLTLREARQDALLSVSTLSLSICGGAHEYSHKRIENTNLVN